MSYPTGINLGSNCSVAKYVSKICYIGSELYHIPSDSCYTMSSDIFIDFDSEFGKDEIIFGKTAFRRGILHPNQYLKNFLKIINNNDNYIYESNYKQYSSTDIASIIIRHLLYIAEGVEGPGTYIPGGLVLSVPYSLNNKHQIFENAALRTLKNLY